MTSQTWITQQLKQLHDTHPEHPCWETLMAVFGAWDDTVNPEALSHTIQQWSPPPPQSIPWLRHLLHSEPDPMRWEELVQALDGWPDDDSFQLAMDYTLRGLERWPDSVRSDLQGEWKTRPRSWPLVRRVSLHGDLGKRKLKRIASEPWLASITQLSLGGPADKTEAVLGSPHLNRLTYLDLGSWNATSLQELAHAPRFEGLTQLGLSGYGRDGDLNEALEVLAQAPWLPGLRTLSLRGTMDTRGAEALATVSFRNLECLDLSGMSRPAARALSRNKTLWRHLSRLDFGAEELEDDELIPIVDALAPAPLGELSMRMSSASVERLLQLPVARHLQTLLIHEYTISHTCMELFARAELDQLRVLWVSLEEADEEGADPNDCFAELARSPHLRALEELRVYNYFEIESADAIRALDALRTRSQLKSLWLSMENLVGDAFQELIHGPLITLWPDTVTGHSLLQRPLDDQIAYMASSMVPRANKLEVFESSGRPLTKRVLLAALKQLGVSVSSKATREDLQTALKDALADV